MTGSRQIGKTYILDEFARDNYSCYLKLDFSDASVRHIFEEDIDAEEIIQRIAVKWPSFKPVPYDTVLFFDEIQLCPMARSSIKPLLVRGGIDILASGSMLSIEEGLRFDDDSQRSWTSYDVDFDPDRISKKQQTLRPMGYETMIRMYPMDFEEYLWATGMSEEVTSKIRDRIRTKERFDDTTLRSNPERIADLDP